MFAFTVLAVGRLKSDFNRRAADEYLARLRPYARVNEIEVRAMPFSAANRERARQSEGQALLRALRNFPDAEKIALSETGEQFDSLGFSAFLSGLPRPLVFVVGGSLGLGDEVYRALDRRLALSRLTFPHELARVLLYEQLYRAATLSAGKTYHY